MKQVTVSDELYEQLKNFVVDPFEDTLQSVVGRLIRITNKARDRWDSLGEGDGPALDDFDADAGDSAAYEEPVASSDELAQAGEFESKQLSEPSTL